MKQFISSYQGEADYRVNGKVYRVRTFALGKDSSAHDTQTEVAEVGTVRAKHWPELSEFPPAEVMAEFPGYQGARYNPDKGYAVEYNGSAPATQIHPTLGWLEVRL